MPNVEQEQTLNVWLVELLRNRGIEARQEQKQANVRRVDVDIRFGTVKIALVLQPQMVAWVSDAPEIATYGYGQCLRS